MLDKRSLGVEDKAVRRDDEDTKELPRWRCRNVACKAEYPPGKQPPPICPCCGAATERVPETPTEAAP